MNHFNAHIFITEDFREKLKKNELVRISKKDNYFFLFGGFRNIRKLQDAGKPSQNIRNVEQVKRVEQTDLIDMPDFKKMGGV